MKSTVVPLSVIAGLMIAGSALAVDMPPLAKENKCVSCHAIDKKIVGPSWMDVSKKYKGEKGADAKLFAKVKQGGKGVWGQVAMPPQPAKDADIKQLVKFILALSK